ncbi:hypothetical protein D3C86_2041480 [compost metagenome]
MGRVPVGAALAHDGEERIVQPLDDHGQDLLVLGIGAAGKRSNDGKSGQGKHSLLHSFLPM